MVPTVPNNSKSGILQIAAGMILVCDTLIWDDGWEFECPSMMLSPVIRCFEDGSAHERIVEDVLIDAIVTGMLKPDDFEKNWGWRGYKLPVLRRRFRESLAGKRFPIANYIAHRQTVRIIADPEGKNGELIWEPVK